MFKDRVDIYISNNWKIILKWNLNKYGGMEWTRFNWSEQELMLGSCEHNNKTSGSIKCRKYVNLPDNLWMSKGLCFQMWVSYYYTHVTHV